MSAGAAHLATGIAALLLIAFPAEAEDRVESGELVIEPSTLIPLGFEWYIQGDENRNASVSVFYRKTGTGAWREGLPMLRTGGERPLNLGFAEHFIVPDMFAGSIFDLEPGTDYDVRLALHDPDGVSGDDEKNVRVSTRAEPIAPPDGKIYHVYPDGWGGLSRSPPSRASRLPISYRAST